MIYIYFGLDKVTNVYCNILNSIASMLKKNQKPRYLTKSRFKLALELH
jgi:hypothetical protein